MKHHEICAHRYYVEKQTDPRCADELRFPAPNTYMQLVAALDLTALWKKDRCAGAVRGARGGRDAEVFQRDSIKDGRCATS